MTASATTRAAVGEPRQSHPRPLGLRRRDLQMVCRPGPLHTGGSKRPTWAARTRSCPRRRARARLGRHAHASVEAFFRRRMSWYRNILSQLEPRYLCPAGPRAPQGCQSRPWRCGMMLIWRALRWHWIPRTPPCQTIREPCPSLMWWKHVKFQQCRLLPNLPLTTTLGLRSRLRSTGVFFRLTDAKPCRPLECAPDLWMRRCEGELYPPSLSASALQSRSTAEDTNTQIPCPETAMLCRCSWEAAVD